MDQQLATNILSVVLIAVTAIYVVLTGQIARDSKRMLETVAKQHRETVRPFVVAKLAIYEGAVFSLVIENIGKSVARNLRLSLDKSFFQFGEKRDIRNYAAFNRTIPTFAPGERLTYLLSQGFNMKNERDGVDLTPSSFTVGATYEFDGSRYDEAFLIDTEGYSFTSVSKTSSEYLKEISAHLKKIAND